MPPIICVENQNTNKTTYSDCFNIAMNFDWAIAFKEIQKAFYNWRSKS